MLIGPHVVKHVDPTQVRPCSWEIISLPPGVVSGEAELYAGMCGISETLGFVHMMRESKTDDWGRIVIEWMPVHVLPSF